MTTTRAARAASSLLILVCALLFPGPTAAAQAPTGVTLTLSAQTPYASPEHPLLHISVHVRNTSDQRFGDLSVEVTVGQPIRSRDQYESSLREGPGAIPLVARPFPEKGTLDPQRGRTFAVALDLSAIPGVDPGDSLVYPAQVDVRSGGVPLAALTTAIVYIVRTPEQPVRLSWWAEFTAPPAFNPAGQLADPSFESSIAPDGSLGAEATALTLMAADPHRGDPIDLVIQPSMIDELTAMADGYERADGTVVEAGKDGAANAAALLASLRSLARAAAVQVSTLPFSAPLIPSLLANGLSDDLARQRSAGDAIVSTALGVQPTPEVARPPQGALDEAAIEALARGGASTLLGDVGTVERQAQPNGFAPLPTATLTTSSGTQMPVVLPDPGAEGLLLDTTLQADPVRVAQAVYGELATIWRESPVPAPQPDGSPTVRGIALALPTGLPAGLWAPLVGRIADAPFLRPTLAQEFAAQVNPAGPVASLRSPSDVAFSRTYADGIREERRDVDAYRTMLTVESPAPDRLDLDLLNAESGVYVGETGELAGRAWIDHVHTVTEDVFARVRPRTAQRFTFTSAVGTIPLQMGDPGPTPLRIVVQLRSAWFRFPEGATQVVTLSRPNQVVTFRVEATAGGQAHPIQLLVRAPSGRPLDEPQTLVVRTAAVNTVALVITAAAALGLAVLWVRRLIRVRRSRRDAAA